MAPVQETFTEALEFTSDYTARAWPNVIKHFDPVLIEEALAATGTATIRRRRLPAERTVWLMFGMSVMRDLPIAAVARQLDIALPAADGSRTVASSALSQARARLGPEPMEWLYLRTAEEWAHRSADADRWRGLALYGVDGTTLRVADSVENRDHFGGQDSGRHEGGRDERQSGYPLMKLVVVMALRSHLLAAAAFGPYAIDERAYAASLWDTVPDHSLVLIDRHYLQANVLVPLTSTGTERHWITRAKSNTRFRSIRRLGQGDDLVEFAVSSEARRKDSSLPMRFDARAIHYQRKGYPPQLDQRRAQAVDELGLGDDAELLAQPIDARARLQDLAGARRCVLDRATDRRTDRRSCARARATVISLPVPTFATSRLLPSRERGDDRAHDVADVDEVARLLAVAEDRQRPAGLRAIREDRDHAGVRARRILARAVDVEEAERRRRHAVDGRVVVERELATRACRCRTARPGCVGVSSPTGISSTSP